MTTSVNVQTNFPLPKNRDNIVLSDIPGYQTLYQVDIKFDSKISDINESVLNKYIVQTLSRYPYYIDKKNIIDIKKDNSKNIVTIIVNTKDTKIQLETISNANNFLNNVNDIQNLIGEEKHIRTLSSSSNLSNYNSNNSNSNLTDNMRFLTPQKFIVERKNIDGDTTMYEYNFDGFKPAYSLHHNKTVHKNGKLRHYLKNNNNNPYYYNEIVNTSTHNPTTITNPEPSNNVSNNNFSNINSVPTLSTNITTSIKNDNIVENNDIVNDTSNEIDNDTDIDIDNNNNIVNDEIELENIIEKIKSGEIQNENDSNLNNILIILATILFLIVLIFIIYFIYKKNIIIVSNRIKK